MANRYYNTRTGKYNLSRIMKDAWDRIVVRNNIRKRLSLALSVVWAAAKAEKASSRVGLTEAQQNVARINHQIELTNYLPFNMSKSRRVSALREELRRAA